MAEVNLDVFGQDYQDLESLTPSSTNSTTFQTKLTFTTGVLTGRYRLGVTVRLSHDAGNKVSEVRFRNVTDAVDFALVSTRPTNQADERLISGFALIDLSGVSKTLEIQFRVTTANFSITIETVRAEFWRVS